jgi:CheY-like chemotaxis protein
MGSGITRRSLLITVRVSQGVNPAILLDTLLTFQQYSRSAQSMPNVLCIDDRAEYLSIRKRLLESRGYSVLTATDGAAGIDIVRQGPVDAVVLDYHMPGMDGEAVAKVLKSERPDLPIVLLTGFPYEVPKRLLSVVDAYVQKGQDVRAFLTALERVIKGKAQPESSPRPDDKGKGIA